MKTAKFVIFLNHLFDRTPSSDWFWYLPELYTSITRNSFFTGIFDAATTMLENGKFVFDSKCFQINLSNINGDQSYNFSVNRTSITEK